MVTHVAFRTTGACTGTLVAPDLVLTAAHCTPPNGVVALIADYTFVAGWNRGEYAASSPFAEVYLRPDHEHGPLTTDRLATDAALVRLSEPIPPELVTPMTFGRVPDAPLGFVGYRNGRLHAPEKPPGCAHQTPLPDVIQFACPVVSGNSGSPLIDFAPLGPRIVGVVSAQSGQTGLAVGLQDWMREYLPDAW